MTRLRCLTFPKLLAAALCVLGLLGIAIMVSAGVGIYCNRLESFWKKNEDIAFPGCKAYDSMVHQEWPSNGFVTMEVMVGGAWTSLLFWVVVLGINITAYLQRRKQAASFGFKEMPDTATSS